MTPSADRQNRLDEIIQERGVDDVLYCEQCNALLLDEEAADGMTCPGCGCVFGDEEGEAMTPKIIELEHGGVFVHAECVGENMQLRGPGRAPSSPRAGDLCVVCFGALDAPCDDITKTPHA